jgi:tetratricopeptide (TPR) repeat protein
VAVAASGAWQTGAGEPYALSPRAALLNLPAFVAAATAAGAAWRAASDLAWGRAAFVQVLGWTVLAVWLVVLVARRSTPAWFSFAWYLALLAPVLVLQRQFYFYYLYCALPGLVASVAFLVVGPAGPSPAAVGRPLRRAAGAAVVALVVAQAIALEARATSWLAATPLPSDFVLRRAFIARNAIADLARYREALGPRVVLLGQQPVEASWQGAITTKKTDFARDPWWDENVRAALSDGEALRLMYPIVREAVFKPWLEPADTDRTIVPYRVDGHLEVSDYASFVGVPDLAAPATLAEHLERAGRFLTRRLFQEALRELLAARELAPDHPDVLINLGALQANMGDSTGALATLEHAAAVTPGDVDALYNLGLIQWRLGRQAEARATWERLLARAPGSDLARSVRELQAGRAN